MSMNCSWTWAWAWAWTLASTWASTWLLRLVMMEYPLLTMTILKLKRLYYHHSKLLLQLGLELKQHPRLTTVSEWSEPSLWNKFPLPDRFPTRCETFHQTNLHPKSKRSTLPCYQIPLHLLLLPQKQPPKSTNLKLLRKPPHQRLPLPNHLPFQVSTHPAYFHPLK